MINDRQIIISTANNRWSTNWAGQVLQWSELVAKLQFPARGVETLAEYLSLPKPKQDNLKDVGGFVGGSMSSGRRKVIHMTGRDVITLDLDNIPPGKTADVLRRVDGLGFGYAVYSTRKHEESRPRLRVLAPLSRMATAEEYEPLARRLAAYIGIELCDPTTFEVHRLMYWPSCCADSQYVYTFADRPFLDTDKMLATYADWRNFSEWPEVPGARERRVKTDAAKQGDPLSKNGVVGAFCKTYNIYQAMDAFLLGIYTPVDNAPDRYTFVGGSTVGGAIVYDNGAFLFSHHSTDPAGGRLVNSFDLVRLHRFGTLDDDAKPETPTNKLPSYTAMCQLAVSDQLVAILLNQERYEKATADFAVELMGPGVSSDPPASNSLAVNDANWLARLEVSSTTALPLKTINNILVVLEHDPLIKGKIAFDEFANRGLVLGPMPWDPRDERRDWSNHDDQGLRNHIEAVYKISSPTKVDDALGLCAHKNRINDVQNYLKSLSWDGAPRLDTLFIDFLGATDSLYTREVTRKAFTAAVARAMEPGIKFDYVLILVGPQGVGKSTLLRLMGRDWYSDNLTSFDGKEAAELIQGIWINELGELSSLNRSESNIAKQFLSRTEDIYREPFGKRTAKYPRRCVFFGTTNESEFLKDVTGNRRFWPVAVGEWQPRKSVFDNLPYEVDQIWAEAFNRWRFGEPLYLSQEVESLAHEQQELYRESSAKEGLIREFIERPVPLEWVKRSLAERRLYWAGEFGRIEGETEPRDRVCAAEVWFECLGGDLKYMKRSDAVEINGILSRVQGWKRCNSNARYGPYGIQKGFIKMAYAYLPPS